MERAQRILNESIAFRTSLIPSIHAEIHKLCWDGWIMYRTQRDLCKSRSDERKLAHSDGTSVYIGGGKRHYCGTLRGTSK